MATNRTLLSEIFRLAWQFVKKNGFTLSEALKTAWRNFRLKAMMAKRIVKFYFQKVDGSLREAYGTLSNVPETLHTNRATNPTVQTYYDTEREEWRCFKKANLMKIVY